MCRHATFPAWGTHEDGFESSLDLDSAVSQARADRPSCRESARCVAADCAGTRTGDYYGAEIYRQAPPVPERVVTTDGSVLLTGQESKDGQNVWQSQSIQQIAAIGRRYCEFVEVFKDVKSETVKAH